MPLHQCSRCMRAFTRTFNYQRHQSRLTLCSPGERVGTIIIEDLETRSLRRETTTEREVHVKTRKREFHLKDLANRQKKARERAHTKRGVRQGTAPKKRPQNLRMVQDKNHDRGTPLTLRPSQMSQEEIDAMKWRGIIRAVHWRNMDEPEICARSCDLASLCSPGEYYVPKWVQSMYYAMGSIFRRQPDIWNSKTNTWADSGFSFEDSDGQPSAELQEIYCRAKYDAEWATGLYDGDL